MRYDVIVVGGGPSGAMAAKTCSENGLKVLLIEKESLPRYKACGGAVSKKAIDLISPLDDLEIKYKVFGARVFPPNSTDYIEQKFENLLALLTFRDSLDYLLVKRAKKIGVEIRECEKVINVNIDQISVNVETTKSKYSASIIIGADGVNSLVARKTGLRQKWNSNKSGICIETEIELTDSEIEQFIDDDELVYLYFGDYRGYGWVFPKGNIMSVGVGLWKPLTKKPLDVFNHFIDALSKTTEINLAPLIKKKIAHMIPTGGLNRNTFGNRTILVGDAAGFVDPFLGEGIYYSLASGIIAGNVASESVKCDNYSKKQLTMYEKKCNKCLNNDLKYALKFADLVYGHFNIFFYLMRIDPILCKMYVLTGKGDLTYKKYFKFAIIRSPFTLIKVIQYILRHYLKIK
jgi:geranylgeranyl reductase family protein